MATIKKMKNNAFGELTAVSLSKREWCLYWNIDMKKIIASKPTHTKPGDRYYDFEEKQWKIKLKQ